ncbi:hypothetical protein HNI00_13285 [Thermoleptolyngbya oregonensis NK1-22]|uniref:Uncharacterized protein n=1 Tax=Thermoleptolyngbya oregonensis NK1-22 TaxID=2547457 RepID=A0AA96Y792_9CYAN|nr:hypothetical protein [Thermoleptolyngbya oregonensis]WOB44014.1 hypothetical protein HNI00_13285 [Thermoleptolyngbya oregonensis NK1-22]
MKRNSGVRFGVRLIAAAVFISLQGAAIARPVQLAARQDSAQTVQRSDLIRPITPIDRIDLPRDTSGR